MDESFAVRRRAAVSHSDVKEILSEGRPTSEQLLGGNRWVQKAEHVRHVAREIYGPEAKQRADEIVSALRLLPRFSEMNTRMMIEAWKILGDLNREDIEEGIRAEEENDERAADYYEPLMAKVLAWRDPEGRTKEYTDPLKATLMRYAIAIVKAGLRGAES